MNPLIIANTQIRRDAAGRYCLNDLHQASGGAKRHQPSNWIRLDQTQELIAEIEKSSRSEEGLLRSEEAFREFPERCKELAPIEVLQGGFVQGTYAVKELVYAYAMWISPAFHVHVIRSYDALVTQARQEPPVITPPLMPAVDHRADQLVSAGRVFSAAMRTARSLKLSPARAMRAAFDRAKRHTGINWEDELGTEEIAVAPVARPEHVGVAPA